METQAQLNSLVQAQHNTHSANKNNPNISPTGCRLELSFPLLSQKLERHKPYRQHVRPDPCVGQWLVRAFVYCYPITKNYWTVFTMISFFYFLGTVCKDYFNAEPLSIVHYLLWGNSIVLWLSFVLEAFIRYVSMSIDGQIRVNPDSNWKNFKECMPHLLNYLCGASFAVTSAVVTLNSDSVPAHTELIASVVLCVFYMTMAFGKDFGYSPSIAFAAAILGLMVLKRGGVVGCLVCVTLYISIHQVYPLMSAYLGPHLKNWGETGDWELPAQSKKTCQLAPLQQLPGFVSWIFNPIANGYQLLLLERLQILLILFAILAASVILIAQHHVLPSMAGHVYNGIGTFLEWVSLKHVCFREYA